MNIKKVSEQTGVSADTIRYYERIGLLPRVRRNKSGVRDFSEQDIAALEFTRMKILEEQREKLISRIAELQAAKERLDYKIENYKKLILKK